VNTNTNPKISRFSQSLISWFKKNKKIYPWRTNRTPYSVWISEIMLQQTVVSAVVPHFQKWMKTFPDIRTLASSSENKVLASWEGLGYYSRGRNIYKTSKILVERFNGKIPDTMDSLLSLPGIGPYTAAAILSMAFNQPYTLIDANVKRICQRILAKKQWDKKTEIESDLFLKKHIPSEQPGIFNESLMELGQTICRTVSPACFSCPVRKSCKAEKKGIQETIPTPEKSTIKHKRTSLYLIIQNGKVMMKKNKEGMFKGMYVFPTIPADTEIKNTSFLKAMTGLDSIPKPQRLGVKTHLYTKYKDSLNMFSIKIKDNIKPKKPWQMMNREALNSVAMPALYRKILNQYA